MTGPLEDNFQDRLRLIRDTADEAMQGTDTPPDDQPQRENRLRGKLLTLRELYELPPAKPLIQDVLDLDSESWLIGPSGGFKSFAAIDWACHVATGTNWRGRRVTPGPVLYVVAEGTKSFGKRVKAWAQAHDMDPEKLIVLPEPVQAKGANDYGDIKLSAEWRDLIEVAEELQPVLIVLDTQARMTLGLNENDNGQMGVWINAVSALKRATKACVLVVHHTGRNGGDARGASAIDAAQDAEWKMERIGDRKSLRGRLSCDKNKDGADTLSFAFAMQVVTVGVTEDGDEITSLVPGELVADVSATDPARLVKQLAESLTQKAWLLGYIKLIAANAHGIELGIKTSELKTGVPRMQRKAGLPPGSILDADAVYRLCHKLLEGGQLTNMQGEKGPYRGHYWITGKGLDEAPDLGTFADWGDQPDEPDEDPYE